MPWRAAIFESLSRLAARRLTLPLICLLAFLLRFVAGIMGTDHFWSYTAYFFVADTLVHGGGYCMEPGRLCAFFPPVFPSVVALGILSGNVMTGVVVLNSLAGAGTVWMTSRIGAALFSPAVGLLAALYAAVYPYYVWHDGVLQENAVLALVVAFTIVVLIEARRRDTRTMWFAAGAALALTVLTKANLLSFVPLAVLWIGITLPGAPPIRLRRISFATFGVLLLLVPWVVRTWKVTGAPILYSNGGFSLWTSNNRLTFDYIPQLSIDAAQEAEWLDVPPADRHEMYELGDPNFIRETKWFWNRGMVYIRAHPWLTLSRMPYKIWIAFSPVFSPAHTPAFEAVYFASYLPLLCLAPLGFRRARGHWRTHGFIYLLFAAFAVSCAVFWGHTSHRMYLDPYLMVFAASLVCVPGKSA